jgi:hypothetical protein
MVLGDKATVTYYKTLSVVSEQESDSVVSVYAVTYPAEFDGMETLFVQIAGRRMYPSESQGFTAAGWRIEGMPVFHLPDEFKLTEGNL